MDVPVIPAIPPAAASQLAEAGIPVFPIRIYKNGRGLVKEPICDHGFKAATTVLNCFDTWEQNWFGIPIPPGYVCIDVDAHKGMTTDKIDQALGVSLDWDMALVQRTPSGGEHYIFRVPDDVEIRQGSNLFIEQIGEGFDTRTPGKGFIASGYGMVGNDPIRYEQIYDTGVLSLTTPDDLPELAPAAIERLKIVRKQRSHPTITHTDTRTKPANYAEVISALKFLKDQAPEKVDDYDTWLKVGMALKHWWAGSFEIWDRWSKPQDHDPVKNPGKYDPDVTVEKWDSFQGEGTTINSLFKLANDAGWRYRPPANDGPPDNFDQEVPMAGETEAEAPEVYPDVIPLNASLPPVKAFDTDMLPGSFANFVSDISERVQCPPDYVGVSVMIALASIIGKRAAIHPKQFDNWAVTPNLWGALIGRPSAMKSPAMREALRPLKKSEAAAKKQYENEKLIFEAEKMAVDVAKNEAKKLMSKAVQKNNKGLQESAKSDYASALEREHEEPVQRRYIVNDATVEKLGEILNQNPFGVMLERDELSGWLANMDREDRQGDRAFYLEAFDGSGSYTYDRIGRGTIHINNLTLSILGGIQPAKLMPHVWNAVNQGDKDDGLIQRLQMAVYPDDKKEWRRVDKFPNSKYRDEVFAIFEDLDKYPALEPDDYGEIEGVRFDEEAQLVFNLWYSELMHKARSDDIHPAMEAHLMKYASLMPSIALIINEVEVGHLQSVTVESAQMAVSWCEYLESHAERIYSAGINPAAQNALTIFNRRDKLPEIFTPRLVTQKGWAGLANTEQVKAALSELTECNYLIEEWAESSVKSGRPSIKYRWNPNIENF